MKADFRAILRDFETKMKISSICEFGVRKYTPHDIEDDISSGRFASVAEDHPIIPAVQEISVSCYQINVHSRSAIRRVPRNRDPADIPGVLSESCDQFLFRIHLFYFLQGKSIQIYSMFHYCSQ